MCASLFTKEEYEEIKETNLRQVILDTTDISPDHIQEDIFFWQSSGKSVFVALPEMT